MYSKQEAAQLRQEFWTTFGQYMSPILSADGERVNWINYKTGEKDLSFKMEADNRHAIIAVELSQKDLGIQEIYFEQLAELKKLMESALGEPWIWARKVSDPQTGRVVSRVYRELYPVNLFRKDDWPVLISFFKERLLGLDRFWNDARYSFEALRS
jgi:Domain of unknown function (DUF4268)